MSNRTRRPAAQAGVAAATAAARGSRSSQRSQTAAESDGGIPSLDSARGSTSKQKSPSKDAPADAPEPTAANSKGVGEKDPRLEDVVPEASESASSASSGPLAAAAIESSSIVNPSMVVSEIEEDLEAGAAGAAVSLVNLGSSGAEQLQDGNEEDARLAACESWKILGEDIIVRASAHLSFFFWSMR